MKVQVMIKKLTDCWGSLSFFAYDETGQIEEDFWSIGEAIELIMPNEQGLIQAIHQCEDETEFSQFKLFENGSWSAIIGESHDSTLHASADGFHICTPTDVFVEQDLATALSKFASSM